MRWPTILFTLFLPACATGPVEVLPNQEFELSQGRSARITGTGETVTFVAVPEDSRCPSDAACVWAGNALVQIQVRSTGRDSTLGLNTTVEPQAGTVGAVRVELRSLGPLPLAGQPIPQRSYRARLLVRGS